LTPGHPGHGNDGWNQPHQERQAQPQEHLVQLSIRGDGCHGVREGRITLEGFDHIDGSHAQQGQRRHDGKEESPEGTGVAAAGFDLGRGHSILPDSIFSILVIALIPLSIMVAVLRYQLLDIRLVLSRSVLYVLLTAAVVGTYLLIVAVSDAVLRTGLGLGPRTGHAPIAVAFNPVRVWLQRKVERVIYGARRDPAEAMAAVGARLGEVGGADSAGFPGSCRPLRP
jgi:hypothetical protein